MLALIAKRLFPSPEHCGNHPRVSATVYHSYDHEGLQLGRIGDQVVANQLEAKRTPGKPWSEKPVLRELNQQFECRKELPNQP